MFFFFSFNLWAWFGVYICVEILLIICVLLDIALTIPANGFMTITSLAISTPPPPLKTTKYGAKKDRDVGYWGVGEGVVWGFQLVGDMGCDSPHFPICRPFSILLPPSSPPPPPQKKNNNNNSKLNKSINCCFCIL